MSAIRNLLDQIFDGSAKTRLRSECKLVIGPIPEDYSPLGTKEDFEAAHDNLTSELSKIGRITEETDEVADFYMDRYAGDHSWIGIVCDRCSARIILAVLNAQQSFQQPYPVHLDCDDSTIAIHADGVVTGSADDDDGMKELARFGFQA